MRLLANITAHGGDVALLSITAPSLPWDTASCSHPPAERCSGPRGCTVISGVRWRWNSTAPSRWRRLHLRASQRVRRAGLPLRMLAREWEYQARGVLHMHVVVPMSTARERHAAHEYVRHLADLAGAHGFGYVDRGKRGTAGRRYLEVVPPGRAAAYLAKYLAPVASGGKMALAETVQRDDVPPLVVYVSRHLTARTLVTMRTLRLRRAAYVLSRERGVSFALALCELLDGLVPTPELLAGADPVRGP